MFRPIVTRNLLKNARFYATRVNVAIVGSGPSGFYTAKYLMANKDYDMRISMIERLPTPYGLVRYGVAADHPAVKLCINDFRKIGTSEGFNYFGNVRVGETVRVDELRSIFDIIVMCYGAETESKLGIKGEDLFGVESAKSFVEWYNGLPAITSEEEDRIRGVKYEQFFKKKNVAVIGQGNVALDVSRIILRPVESLKKFDVNNYALEVLAKSSVENVYIIGRRGPVQIACTSKELRELSKVESVNVCVDPGYLELDEISKRELERDTSGQLKKKLAILESYAKNTPKPGKKNIHFKFFNSPAEFIGKDALEAVKLEKTRLEEKDGKVRAVGTGNYEELECGVVFRSIGYRSIPIEGIPFNHEKGRVLNDKGRIIDENGIVPGLYTAGWVKRGPSGVVGTNIDCARETVKNILEDLKTMKLNNLESEKLLTNLLNSRNAQFVTFDEYLKLEKYEEEQGKKLGKIRDKVLRVEEMMKICKS